MTIKEAKEEYNQLLKRYHKANEYFDRTDVTQEDKEKFLPHFQSVLNGLNKLLMEIGDYKQEEVLGGFR